MEKQTLQKFEEDFHPINAPLTSIDNNIGYDTLAKTDDLGRHSIDVLINGIYCAACIQKIESGLANNPAVISARLNFTTKRLHIIWNSDVSDANKFVKLIESYGYTVYPYDIGIEQEGTKAEEKFLLLCLGVAGFSMGNIMLLSVGLWSSSIETMGVSTRDFLHWISAIIALPTIIFSGRPFFRSAFKALKNKHTNMDVPISLAITLAGIMSLYETIRHSEHAYFDSAVMLIFFLLIGRYLDFRARSNARSAATDLLSTLNGFAQVIDGDHIRTIAIRDIQSEMLVRVAVGDKFPIDGIIFNGETEVDTSLITGETLPRAAQINDEVYAGTINLLSPVTVKVSKAAEDSLLADIVRLMEKAEQGQARYVRIADRMAKLYTPFVHTLAIIGFIWWYFIAGAGGHDAIMVAVTILIITCPCALGLAVPIVQVLATSQLMRSGILVKSGDALERLAEIDTVFFDKTGTLTLGKPTLISGINNENLCFAASLAQYSRHPLSKALSASFDGNLITFDNVQEISGKGLSGTLNGETFKIGNKIWCDIKSSVSSNNSDLPELWFTRSSQENPTHFIFNDLPRPDTQETLDQLKAFKLHLTLVSGDRESAAQNIGCSLGIEKIYAPKTPPEKFEIMEMYKQKGHKILMIGDGLNDAPVLAGADISIAPGSAIDIAQSAADIVFLGDSLKPVAYAYKVATFSQKLVKENFALAILYNFIAVPIAFMGWVTPMIAAIAMSGSSLVVIANSFRLRSIK